MQAETSLIINGVSKTYSVDGAPLQALSDIRFAVEPGEFVTILGASGCGKSTLLRLIIGLDTDYDGDILLDGHRILGPGAERGIVFQEPRLLPWLTVEQNVALGLDDSGISPAMIQRISREHLKRVRLAGFEQAYPHQLSGGMAQRAGIARALVSQPKILLMDEPLGALDSQTRAYMQDEILRIWERERVTVLMVTHDIEEAIYLSSKIVVMEPRPGRVRTIQPVEWEHPRDRHSQSFARLKDRIGKLLAGADGENLARVAAEREFIYPPAMYGG